jgi:hypothetical protein
MPSDENNNGNVKHGMMDVDYDEKRDSLVQARDYC